jgi:hypothetical protein
VGNQAEGYAEQRMAWAQGEASMTEEQYLVLAGCIWLAPHIPKQFAQIGSSVIFIAAAAIALGWLP